MKVAVVGTGLMGCEHIRNLRYMQDVDLVAVAEKDDSSKRAAIEACADQFSPTLVDDYRELTAFEPDAIIIATPNHTHIDLVRDLAESPAHLLLEKPVCTNIEDGQELMDIDANRDAMIWVALEYRFMTTTQRFLESIPLTGKLKMLFIREHRFPFLPKVDDWNRFNRNTGGTLVEKCCHFFDLMNLAIQSKPLRALATGSQAVNHIDERIDGEQPDIIDNAYVLIEYENGVRACLDLCMFAEGSRNEQELIATGSAGKVEAFIPENQLNFLPRTGEGTSSVVMPDPDIQFMGYHHGASFLEQRAFFDAIRSGSSPAVTTQDGFLAMSMGIAAHESIELGRAVDIVLP